MRREELKKATLYEVINQTLVEYLHDCLRTPYNGNEVDRCGYIGQILNKVKEQNKRTG